MTTSRIDNNILITSIINSIVTIIAQIDGIYKILIMINTTNGILIHTGTLDMKICNGYILNTSEIFVIAIIHDDEVHISICKTDDYHAIIIKIF